jgi:hypothetical protein
MRFVNLRSSEIHLDFEDWERRGHREVTSETLLPIILEVGTLGHILLTDYLRHETLTPKTISIVHQRNDCLTL